MIYDEKQKRDRKLTKIYLDNLVKRERGYFYKERFLFVNQLGTKSFGKVYLVDEVELKERYFDLFYLKPRIKLNRLKPKIQLKGEYLKQLKIICLKRTNHYSWQI